MCTFLPTTKTRDNTGKDEVLLAHEHASWVSRPRRSVDSPSTSQFFVDPDGRVPFAGDVSFDFRSAPKALTAALAPPEVLARVVKDCQVREHSAAQTEARGG